MGLDDKDIQENADTVVRNQYEAHPYPPRDPDDECGRLITGSPSHIHEINHYVFEGKRDFSRPFRALIAGGGTGDATVMLAHQLAERGDGEVVYVDISEASLRIAEARVQARNLSNVSFHRGSILDISKVAPGTYDYIDCCGVLHHLADPVDGLNALAGSLDENGGMGLMLYGALGRTGVYPAQDAIRKLTIGMEEEDRLALARRLVESFPESNWLKRNLAISDYLLEDDAAFVDLLLHSRDRAYTVPEIEAIITGSGFSITGFIEPVRYDPTTYLDDEILVKKAKSLPWTDQCAIAESIAGNLKTHVFYVVPSDRGSTRPAQTNNPNMVPIWRNDDGPVFASRLSSSNRIKVNFDGLALSFELPKGAENIAKLIDCRRSLGDLQIALNQDWITFKAGFDRLYKVLNGLNLMLLRRS
tara:strand:+ start:852 stop:2102 length:1251 start_codon:yes stop_codon:yes gene_type:complete